MKKVIFYLSLLVSSLVSFTTIAEQEQQRFSDAELAQMLAPIALYPDSLLTHILISSTYPIEIIEAYRWSKKNENLNTEQKNQLLDSFDWDASVKALIPFERVLSRLSEDLSWMQSLGDAFLQDESRLLLSIQTLRKQAKLAGNLSQMDNMDIDYEDNNIIILPREKNVVYVPYYDSRIVYGSWFYSAYPPIYWQPHHSAYVSRHRPFSWHTGVHITFNYFFSAFHWHNRHVVVVSPHRARYYNQRPRRLIANGGYAKRWSHQPTHRKGVAYRTKQTSNKYHSKRVSTHRTNTELKNSQRKFKQRLHTSNHSPRKAQQKANSDNIQPRQENKQLVMSQKSREKSNYKTNKNHKVNKQTRKQKTNLTKRETSSMRKQHQNSGKTTSSHKSTSTQRNHSNKGREIK